MLFVKSHEYNYRDLHIEFENNGSKVGDPYPLASATFLADGYFDGEKINSVSLVDAPPDFKDGKLIEEWSKWGEAAEAQGPFILEGQEFTLKGLIEYLAQKYDIEKDR